MSYSLLPSRLVITRILIAFLLLVLACAAALGFATRYWNSPIESLETSVFIEVRPGSSFARVTRELAEAGYVGNPQLFTLLARWRGVSSAIKAGEYELQAGITPAELLSALVQGNTRQYRVTLVEGWTFREALSAIWRSEKIDRQLMEYDPLIIAGLLDLEVADPEGMLFPDTYFYDAGTSDLQILRRAHARLETILDNAWQQRLGALPYAGPYEALILASIIEKESAYGAERGHIAGVFVRRLESGMRLQSDPTVIYGLGDSFTGNLTREHLQQQTAYNTYRIPALPPTPIALAGLESITASLHPLPGDSLYFVSKGNGEHHFSTTLEEHNAAVQRYQSGGATN